MFYLYRGTGHFGESTLFNSKPPTEDQYLGDLPKVLSCEVERDTEGLFDMTLSCNLEDRGGDLLDTNIWIRAPAGGDLGPQYFCIDRWDVSERKVVTVHANHISYNSADILAMPFTAEASGNSEDVSFFPWCQTLEKAVKDVDTYQMGNFSIIGYTDDMKLNAARYTEPVSLRQAVFDAIEGRDILIRSTGTNLMLWKDEPEGANPSFTIRYGKNLLTYSGTKSYDDFYTFIFPYFFNMEEGIFTTYYDQTFPLKKFPAKYVGVEKIRPVDFTGLYGLERGTAHDLLDFEKAINTWLEEHPFKEASQEISLESVPDEGNQYELGRCGYIYSPDGTVSRVTIVSLKYDALRDRVTQIGVGKVRRTLSGAIAALERGRKP